MEKSLGLASGALEEQKARQKGSVLQVRAAPLDTGPLRLHNTNLEPLLGWGVVQRVKSHDLGTSGFQGLG